MAKKEEKKEQKLTQEMFHETVFGEKVPKEEKWADAIAAGRGPKESRVPKTPAWEKLNNRRDVVAWERNNFDKIVFYYTGTNFWQTTMHSCFFMVNLVHEHLGLGSKIKTTLDYYLNTDRVFTAYHKDKIEQLKKDLQEKEGMKLLKDSDTVMVFEMVKEIAPEMLADWERAEEIRRQKIDAYLMPVGGSSELYVLIRGLGKYTILAMERVRESARCFTVKLMEYLEVMYDLYIDMNEQNRVAMLRVMGRFSYFVQILNDEQIIDDKKAHNIGVRLHKIRRELEFSKAPKQ